MLSIFKSRTIMFAIALAVLSVVQNYIDVLPLSKIGQMWVGIGIAVIVTVLRFITTKPVMEK